jgi:hypothetical protein
MARPAKLKVWIVDEDGNVIVTTSGNIKMSIEELAEALSNGGLRHK